MDKTYNDLMDIVSRTKKMGGDDSPKVRKRVVREEPMDEAVETVREIKSVRPAAGHRECLQEDQTPQWSYPWPD